MVWQSLPGCITARERSTSQSAPLHPPDRGGRKAGRPLGLHSSIGPANHITAVSGAGASRKFHCPVTKGYYIELIKAGVWTSRAFFFFFVGIGIPLAGDILTGDVVKLQTSGNNWLFWVFGKTHWFIPKLLLTARYLSNPYWSTLDCALIRLGKFWGL